MQTVGDPFASSHPRNFVQRDGSGLVDEPKSPSDYCRVGMLARTVRH